MKTQRLSFLSFVSFVLLMCLLNWPLSAQEEGFFGSPVEVEDEFLIDIQPTEANLAFPTLVDIDGDGDLDLFYSSRIYNLATYCWVTTAFDYYENQGSDECPEFTKKEGVLFGLPDDIAVTQFVDIDADGDLDLFTSTHCNVSTISYYENTGSATEPAFSNTPSLSFNTGGIFYSMIVFGDLDNDGDYDALINGIRPGVFKYLENTGNANQFQFGTPVDNPFGLEIPAPYVSEWSLFADWDCDGDLDIFNSHLLTGTGHNAWVLYYHENAGSPEQPAFLPPVLTGDTLVVATFGDLDGDGDLDIITDEYYYQNINQPKGCVTEPVAHFSYYYEQQPPLTIAFTNESTALATDCHEVKWSWDFGDHQGSTEENPVHTYQVDGNYTVRLIAEDVAGSDTFERAIDVILGVRQESIEDYFVCYPNPVSDALYLEPVNNVELRDGRVEIFNALGQKVEDQAFHLSSSIRINVQGLPTGNYVLKIHSEGVFLTQSFMKVDRP